MNQTSLNAARSAAALDALQTRFALRVAAHLSEDADRLPPDLSERLRFARERAVEHAQAARRARSAPSVSAVSVAGGSLAIGGGFGRLGGERTPWWLKFAAIVPLAALVVGLVTIEDSNTQAQINAAADIDAALLSDDLPPNAYTDPGFAEYLKTSHE